MASASAGLQAVPNGEDAAQNTTLTANLVDALYEKCSQQPEGSFFFQRDLSNMQVVGTLNELMVVLQEMADRHLMKSMSLDGEPCWKLRSREEAEKLRKLTPDERVLFHHIDQAQTDGIWTKALRMRTNHTPQMITKILKSLESKDLVQSVMSVKNPNRKMYLLKHLRPSEDIAGGPWQTDGEFDMNLIKIITDVVETIIDIETHIKVPADWNNWDQSNIDRTADIARKKAQARGAVDIEDIGTTRARSAEVKALRDNLKYPTAASILDKILERQIIKDKEIRISDMDQLLEMMVLDGRIEKTSGTNYRLPTRASKDNREGYNGFVDAPCGNCPVFHLCGDDGEISARTCVYFADWLDTESEAV
ncbi:RNA polymerase Rpc34 [Dendryphion nanum]|uniref:DNA-directed RNA polymerase III subunit RPC6 n=1 Tax=Dendryphion nanum TaxID=256645 RepID=A0A9P9I760_9PLEO|nr:RNA polymerase Rpc34 [Dendryphion nanum]